jgi:pSer/pThr/pTyr-binding forkhead associated (FHA) protein
MPIPRVIILSEIMRGKTFELTLDRYAIGRSEAQHICIPDGTISTLHCELIKDVDGYVAYDKNSTNGTRINGIKITEQRLCNSDILQVGGIELLFDCEDKANTTSITTQTAIDLEKNVGKFMKSNMTNIDPLKTSQRTTSPEGKSKVAFICIIVALVLIVLVLLFLLYKKLFPN